MIRFRRNRYRKIHCPKNQSPKNQSQKNRSRTFRCPTILSRNHRSPCRRSRRYRRSLSRLHHQSEPGGWEGLEPEADRRAEQPRAARLRG